MSSEADKRTEEYRAKAQQVREKAEVMLSEAARRAMITAAEMWEAMAAELERKKWRGARIEDEG